MKKSKSFNSCFSNTIAKDKNLRFTILLGSGFHKLEKDRDSVLNSWGLLLKTISPKFEGTGNYLLDFEKIILNQVSVSNAQKEEYGLIKKIASKIKDAEKNALDKNTQSYPSFIFNSNYVSDVISLNFDCIAEKLCILTFKAKLIKRGFVRVNKKSGKDSLVHQTTKYRILEFPGGKTITFWYPHGSVLKSSGIILGARKYGQHIGCIESLRKYSKANARENEKKDTWYDKLTHNPVLILGASISSNEWDIWSAFVNRERNFSKKSNQIYRNPVFQMRSDKCKKECEDNTNQKWFQPLFDEKLEFNEQWIKLKQLFNNEK